MESDEDLAKESKEMEENENQNELSDGGDESQRGLARVDGLPWSHNSCHVDTTVELVYWAMNRDVLPTLNAKQVKVLGSVPDVQLPFASFIATLCTLRHNLKSVT